MLGLLSKNITDPDEVNDIRLTAQEVAARWIPPLEGGKGQTNGLIYGLVQSGKTGVLTVTGAIGADEGYRTILILTSDNDPLYEQTLGRVREAFPGIDVIGKNDLKDQATFIQRLKGATTAIVITKNGNRLKMLIENLKVGRLRGLTCLIIDDEADQASLNTRAAKDDGTRSTINNRLTELRSYFDRNTYIQVTATPQALFLQTPAHDFRPKFTILSHPGAGYVGGDDFFGDASQLVREFPLGDITALTAGAQPSPTATCPKSLLQALDIFMIGAAYKRQADADQNCAFLCHVSTKTADHSHIVGLLHRYRTDLAAAISSKQSSTLVRLEMAYNDLAATDERVAGKPFRDILEAVAFFCPGTVVKLVNGDTDEDVAVKSPFNLFVGGNKLGRGVTIKNLLVSYYGRNPRSPQADTVLQHARMYGYRRNDIGLLRLFLPAELHTVFKAIHRMERGLRTLIAERPGEEFRGVYLENGLKPTRRSVLAPGALGIYAGGSIYNPAQVIRDNTVAPYTNQIDALVKEVKHQGYAEMALSDIARIIELTKPDSSVAEKVWNPVAVGEAVQQFGKLHHQSTGYVYVARDRGLVESRRETQGILDGGEQARVPADKITLFLLRTSKDATSQPVWWPQMRFPAGRYAFAFAI